MKTAALLVLTVTVAGQNGGPTAPQLLNTARPLRPDEIATVLAGVRAAIAGRTVRLAVAPDGPGPDIVVGADGRPRMVRTVGGITGGMISADGIQTTWQKTIEMIADYTSTPARRCDGTPLDGELVIEYRNENDSGWKAIARAATGLAAAARPLAMVSQLPRMESGGMKTFGDRRARAIVAPWTPPSGTIERDAVIGDPFPNAVPRLGATPLRASQTLWIDVDSLQPIRWSASAPGGPTDALTFTYDLSPEPKIPDGIAPPDCVP
jgi:hypothetical protein